MIPNAAIREVETSGVTGAVSFGISSKDGAHIMGILRDTLYSDKILAVLREYSANAWDAHRESGKARNLPISVHVPTAGDPSLRIRDYGHGLSHQDVFEVFTQYGASTKRNSNEAVGMLGIGSKSGFAYSDTFTITSWNGGMKRIYVAALDPSDKGILSQLHEEPCGEETGVEIEIPVKNQDLWNFTNKATNLFQHFEPRPKINIPLPSAAVGKKLKNGSIYDGHEGEWIALMGCIGYRLNIEQLEGVAGFDMDTFSRVGGALYFNIGEVSVNASREELKYSDSTKAMIVKRLNDLVDEYVMMTLDTIKNGGFTPWEQRLRGQVLSRLKLPILKDIEELFSTRVSIKVPPVTFTLQVGKSVVGSISVNADTKLYLQDDKRGLRGFNLNSHDHIVKPVGKSTLKQVRDELDTILATIGATGVPISNLSTLIWTATYRKGGGLKNVKHHVKTFKLLDNASLGRPLSSNWEPETERSATTEDVFVILNSFKGKDQFYDTYRLDSKIAKALGITMPTVYGYKWTEAKPIGENDCLGKSYQTWHMEFVASLANDSNKEIVDHIRQSNVLYGYYHHDYVYNQYRAIGKQKSLEIEVGLGQDHEISKLCSRIVESEEFMKNSKIDRDVLEYLDRKVFSSVQDKDNETKTIANNIAKKYPMMKLNSSGVQLVWGENCKIWIEYIKLVDNKENP